jgi:putative endonuclease
MFYSVYMLISVDQKRTYSYVGYTNDLLKRLRLHNSSKGAKYTRGKKWTIIYKKKYKTKSLAMKEEYRLKKNVKLRSLIKNKYLNKLNA